MWVGALHKEHIVKLIKVDRHEQESRRLRVPCEQDHGAPEVALAWDPSQDRDPILGEFVVPGSQSQLF